PLSAKVTSDIFAEQTIVVVGKQAPRNRVEALSKQVEVWLGPSRAGKIDLGWLLEKLGEVEITHLLVEGGGEVNASFLEEARAQRVEFFYAPRVIGGRQAPKS